MLGFETSDDAAVWRLSDDLAAVLTVDFFTPIVDDPYEFGRIAAANALSDIFAMGARPQVALNLLALSSSLGVSVASEILRGGADAVREAGAQVAGGHTIDDDEPKYGLSVFGTVHPDRIVRNTGAQPGDVLYLTKPLGTGILCAAQRINAVSEEEFRPAVASMMELNAAASAAMLAAGAADEAIDGTAVGTAGGTADGTAGETADEGTKNSSSSGHLTRLHAATDVTGFGFAGHLHEMLEASSCSALIDFDALPLLPRAWELSCAYCRPNRCFSIMDGAEAYVSRETAQDDVLDDETYDNRMGIICDPQTSGGLLIALAPEVATRFEEEFQKRTGRLPWKIGQIEAGEADEAGRIRFVR